MSAHYSIEFECNEEGWWQGRCHCGWDGGLYPDAEDAADALMDHTWDAALASVSSGADTTETDEETTR